jgi:hypothetical protein
VTDVPDADGEIPEMIEGVWDGEGSWLGRGVEVARSPTLDGDVILTLPRQAFMGVHGDGSQDVAIPLAVLRWVLAGDQRDSRPD